MLEELSRYFIFVDTETSGIPENFNAPISDFDSWPFVLQVAWRVYTNDGDLVKKEDHYINEKDIKINKSSFKIHGISKGHLTEHGDSRKWVMRRFMKDLRYYRPLIVGHFVEFDSKILQVEMLRSGMKNSIGDYLHFCTMKATAEYSPSPEHEFPLLEHLYQKLFEKEISGVHNAAVDAEATAECFFELFRLGKITSEVVSEQLLFNKEDDKPVGKTGCGLPILIFLLMSLWILL